MKKCLVYISFLFVFNVFSQETYRNWTVQNETKKARIALIIANNFYKNNGNLELPIPTSKKLEQSLKAKGFDVMVGRDLDRKGMIEIITDFSKKYKNYEFALISYLGHGFEIKGNNYLIPIDANPSSSDEVEVEAIDVSYILKKINSSKVPKVMILDACRENPFANNWSSSERGSTGNGFVEVDAPRNTEIFFTTQKNSRVRDDNPYMNYFMKELDKGGCMQGIVRRVSKKIFEYNPNQIPAKYGQLFDEVCFGKKRKKNKYSGNNKVSSKDKKKKFKTFLEKVNGVSFKMVAIKSGSFNMGSETGEIDERPVHKVTLDGYYIGETEVTQALWQAVMGNNPSRFKSAEHPVEKVSWKDIQKFIAKLNGITGKNYRLPTEAEWEYAAKGSNYRGVASSKKSKIKANYKGVVLKNKELKTVKVKTYPPNKFGLYEMAGNVSEWCSDWYRNDYYQVSPKEDPKGPEKGSVKVMRGGSWYFGVDYCRPDNRERVLPFQKADSFGFRLSLN